MVLTSEERGQTLCCLIPQLQSIQWCAWPAESVEWNVPTGMNLTPMDFSPIPDTAAVQDLVGWRDGIFPGSELSC